MKFQNIFLMYLNKFNDAPLLSTDKFLKKIREDYPDTFITELPQSPTKSVKKINKKDIEDEEYQNKLIQQFLDKINLNHIPIDYYNSLPVSPGYDILKFLKSKKKKVLNINIIDTILYKNGNTIWLCNNESGAVISKILNNDWKLKFIEKCIEFRGKDYDYDINPVAVFKVPDASNPSSYDTRLLLLSELKKIFDDKYENYILQKYIKSKGNKANIYRVLYHSTLNTYAYSCSNKMKYNGNEIKNKLKELNKKDILNKEQLNIIWWEYKQLLQNSCCVHIQTPETYDNLRIFGDSINEIEAGTYEIIHHLEKVIIPGLTLNFSSFSTDWIKDDNGSWWFISIKGFELKERCLEDIKKWRNDYEKFVQENGEFAEIRGLPECKIDSQKKILTLKDMDESVISGKICGLCKYRYLLWEEQEYYENNDKPLWYSLTNKMIYDFITFFELRGISVNCFNEYPNVTSANQYMSVNICYLCYNLYQSTQELIKTTNKYKSYLRSDKYISSIPSYKITPVKKDKLPDNSTYHRMFISFCYFTTLSDEYPDIPKDSYGEIHYVFGPKLYRIPFDLSKWDFCYCPIKQLRIHHFISDEKLLLDFLSKELQLTIYLGSNSNNLMKRGNSHINFSKFIIGGRKNISKDLFDFDITVILDGFEPVVMKLCIGIIEDSELVISSNKEYEYDGALFFPSKGFKDSHPIPDDWFIILNNYNNITSSNALNISTKLRRSSSSIRNSFIRRKILNDERSLALRKSDFLNRISKRFVRIKVNIHNLSEHVHKLFSKFNDIDSIKSDDVIKDFRSFNKYNYEDLPLIATLLSLSDFIEYVKDIKNEWSKKEIKALAYCMIRGDKYDLIAAFPIKFNQKQRFKKFLNIYQYY